MTLLKTKQDIKFFIIAVFAFISSIVLGYWGFSSLFTPNFPHKDLVVAEREKSPDDVTKNYLLLGVDEREGDVGRADTIVILSLNLAQKRIGLISIPRDSLFSIPSHGEDKINHAYGYGGVKLTKELIEKRFDLKVDNYVIFNFASFKNMIDILGGVNLNVDKDMYYRDPYDGPSGLEIDLKAGEQDLNGEKSMEYVRYRDEEGDIGRVARQQKFLHAFLDKLTSPDKLLKLPSIAREIFSSVKTDMSIGDWLEAISYLRPNQKFEIKSMMVPGRPDMIGGISYWIVDDEKTKEELKDINSFVTNINTKELEYAPEYIENKMMEENSIFKRKKTDENNKVRWAVVDVSKEAEPKVLRASSEPINRENSDVDSEWKEKVAQRNYYSSLVHGVTPETPKYSSRAVSIINMSHDPTKGETAKRLLESHGIDVGLVENTSPQNNSSTVFVVNQMDPMLSEAVEQMGFSYPVVYKNNSERSTLIIGDDFR